MEEFRAYVARIREKLRTLPRSSKQWWELWRFLATGRKEANSAPLFMKRSFGLMQALGVELVKVRDSPHGVFGSCTRYPRVLPDGVSCWDTFVVSWFYCGAVAPPDPLQPGQKTPQYQKLKNL